MRDRGSDYFENSRQATYVAVVRGQKVSHFRGQK
jgi:hypothetical protein